MQPRKGEKQRGARGFGRPGAIGVVEKPKNLKKTLIKLSAYLGNHKLRLFFVIFFAVLSTVFTIFTPKILGSITDEVVKGFISIRVYDEITEKLPAEVIEQGDISVKQIIDLFPEEIVNRIPQERLDDLLELDLSKRPEIDYSAIYRSMYILAALFIASSAFSFIQGWLMTDISQKITYKLRRDISEKINRLPLKYFDTRTYGEVLSRITNDVDTVSQTFNQSISQLITSITAIIGILIMMITIDLRMTGLALLILPLSSFFVIYIVRRSQPLFKQQQDALGDMNGHIEEIFSGHTIVKAFNAEDSALEQFSQINERLYESGWKSQFFSGLMMPVMRFIGNLGYVGACILGGWYAIKGVLSVGDIQAFLQYLTQFSRPIVQTATVTNVLQSTAAAAERVFEFLEEEEQGEDIKTPKELVDIKGHVQFENVVFGYDKDEPVIKGLNVEILPGQRVAIVGPTGAGKTTLVNLLMRFYDIDKGSIKIDGKDIKEIRRCDVRKAFGMVLQDTWLFNGTIRENLVYGNPTVSEERFAEAVSAANVDNYVNSLPGGYDMEINEETDNISQGEKQLLTIARAMIANPPMLILDEATSSVDTRTELAIQKAMEVLMEGRTSFVIAHRLSTIRDADLIFVMNEGNIIEQGTHPELLAKKGFYYDLYHSQFNGWGK